MDNDPAIGPARWAGAVGSECPSDEALAVWIDQGLGITDRAAIDRHLRRCSPCRVVVLQVIEIKLREGADPGLPSSSDEARGAPLIDAARRAWWQVRRRLTALATACVAAHLFRV